MTRVTAGLVSVILVSRNCRSLIDVVFPTLMAQAYQPFEVLVVDNGSTDDTVTSLARRYPSVRVVQLGQNLGFSHALNRGVRDTDGEFVLSLNS